MNTPRFDRRICAYIIDQIIPAGLAVFIYLFFHKKFGFFSYLSVFLWIELLEMFFSMILNSLAAYVFNGNTLGNLCTRSKMVNINGDRLKNKQVLLKYLPLSVWPLVIINAIYMLTVHTEITIFDSLSKTTVILK